MLKNVIIFVSVLLLLSSCRSVSTAKEAVKTPAAEPSTSAIASQDPSAEVGANFKVNVLEAGIKSPRKELVGKLGGVPVTINYGSPGKKGRDIFGNLIKYDAVWRTGANEATRITFGTRVMVGTSKTRLEAGTYGLFMVPSSVGDWTVMFNTVADQWGAYEYDKSSNAAEIRAEAKTTSTLAERMDFSLAGSDIQLVWDDMMVAFPVYAASK